MFNEKELNKKEKWMEGQYDINEIERKTIRNWMDVEMIPQLHVPYSNKYLAESLEMKDDEPSLGKEQNLFNKFSIKISIFYHSFFTFSDLW